MLGDLKMLGLGRESAKSHFYHECGTLMDLSDPRAWQHNFQGIQQGIAALPSPSKLQ